MPAHPASDMYTHGPAFPTHPATARFSRRIYVPLPDRTSRAGLIQRAMEGVATSLSAEQYLHRADRCNMYSGRDLVQVCGGEGPSAGVWGEGT